jgi:hypothetical protein
VAGRWCRLLGRGRTGMVMEQPWQQPANSLVWLAMPAYCSSGQGVAARLLRDGCGVGWRAGLLGASLQRALLAAWLHSPSCGTDCLKCDTCGVGHDGCNAAR